MHEREQHKNKKSMKYVRMGVFSVFALSVHFHLQGRKPSDIVVTQLDTGFKGTAQSMPVRDTTVSEAFFVVSLDGVQGSKSENVGRLDSFRRNMYATCGATAPIFQNIAGTLDSRRGFGLTLSFVNLLEEAKKLDVDVAYIFEDDAILTNSLLCDAKFRRVLWQGAPHDTLAVLLAAHQVNSSGTVTTRLLTFDAINRSHGSYAWAVRKANFDTLLKNWKENLNSTKNDLSPDIDLSDFSENQTTYLLRAPQVARHSPKSFSNTWSRNRSDVVDIEKLSLVIIGGAGEIKIENINKFLEMADDVADIHVVLPQALFPLTGQNVSSIPLHFYALASDHLHDVLSQVVANISSNSLAIFDHMVLVEARRLRELRLNLLRVPYGAVCSELSIGLSSTPHCSSCISLPISGSLLAMSKHLFKAHLAMVASLDSFDELRGCDRDLSRILASNSMSQKAHSFPLKSDRQVERSRLCHSINNTCNLSNPKHVF
jgi:hypothetical protein